MPSREVPEGELKQIVEELAKRRPDQSSSVVLLQYRIFERDCHGDGVVALGKLRAFYDQRFKNSGNGAGGYTQSEDTR